MILLFTSVFVIYFIALLLLITGWERVIRNDVNEASELHFLSVVIPIRNEERNIKNLISNFQGQSYRVDMCEFIFVDDHSEDSSLEILKNNIHGFPNFKVLELREGSGKKQALATGISQAKGEIIITTDADCKHTPGWLGAIISQFDRKQINLVVGPVAILEEDSFFSKLQSLEFVSLAGVAGSSIALQMPLLCNGANLAFRKSIYSEVGGYNGNEFIPSGDDEFLLRKIAGNLPGSVAFAGNQNAIVRTTAHSSLRDLISQRVRWAGKWRFHDFLTNSIALFVVLLHCVFIASVVSLFSANDGLWILSVCIFTKILLESVFLFPVAGFLDVRWRWHHFLLMQFLYPPYVVVVTLLSLTAGFEWKGRRMKHKM